MVLPRKKSSRGEERLHSCMWGYFGGGDRYWLSVLSFISSALGRCVSHLRVPEIYVDHGVHGSSGQSLLLMVVIMLLASHDGGFLK